MYISAAAAASTAVAAADSMVAVGAASTAVAAGDEHEIRASANIKACGMPNRRGAIMMRAWREFPLIR